MWPCSQRHKSNSMKNYLVKITTFVGPLPGSKGRDCHYSSKRHSSHPCRPTSPLFLQKPPGSADRLKIATFHLQLF